MLLWKILRRIAGPFRRLQEIKKKKIYGLTYFGKEDIRYQRLVRKNALTVKRIKLLVNELSGFSYQPKISILMPVYNVERQWLVDAIESVLCQVYTNWEFCIADDASPSPHIKSVLEHYERLDSRIKVKYLNVNQGISGASNEALSMVTGEFTVFLDHDDCLSGDSLFEIVKLLNSFPQADVIYSDEDKLSMGGLRLRPVYKPDWDAELFLTYNYLCHIVVCRTSLINQAGGFRLGFEGSQDYDLLLRVTELTSEIFHIPKVLYHWRMIPGSAASVVDAKSKAFERGRLALEDALKRRGINAWVLDGELQGTFRIVRGESSVNS